MRHLFVTQDFGPELGGMARRHVELCRRFAPDEVVVSTVAATDGGVFDRGEPYQIKRQPFGRPAAKLLLNELRWARLVITECRRGAQVIHCASIRACGYAVAIAKARVQTPYVVYVNGGDLLRERELKATRPWARRTARWILGRASGIVANSQWTADLAREVLGLLDLPVAPPVAAIDLGTDPGQFAPSRCTGELRARHSLGGVPFVLTVARLVPHKGQDVGLHALARLRPEFPELRYVIVGEGPDRGRLERLARELAVADRVLFAGVLSDGELADAYASAAVYLGASRIDNGVNVEGFGISFVEAAASGTPSVAGDSGGVRSAVRDGETGFVVPPGDVDGAARALRVLLADAPLRRRMGTSARRAVETYYNWDRVARETLAFTRQVVGGGATA